MVGFGGNNIINLVKFKYSKDYNSVSLDVKIKLKADEYYASTIFDFGIGKKIICLGNDS